MTDVHPRMRHQEKEMVPKFLVKAMFALMIGTLGIVTFAQLTGVQNTGVLVEAPIVSERVVTMSGDNMRVYTVYEDGEVIAVSSEDKAGFIGVIGLVVQRERMQAGISMDAPLRIVGRENGNVAIIDDSTGLTKELIGYGADNIAAFGNLLD